MEPREMTTEERCVGMAVWMSLVAGAVIAMTTSACSFQVEVGYHGQTGRDDRTQTQLVRGGGEGRGAVSGDKY